MIKKKYISVHQHNIGCCEVQEMDILDSYGQKIRYDRQKKNVRNIKNYLKKTKNYSRYHNFTRGSRKRIY